MSDRSHTTDPLSDEIERRLTKSGHLAQAKTDAHEAWIAIQAGDWLRADIFLKLAIDEIADAGVLP